VSEHHLSVLVVGASGVTGCRAVPYLRERAREDGFRWGIAGRSVARLEPLIADWPAEERPEVLPVDSADRSSVAAAVARTRSIVNFAGPFARLAPPVIEACVEAGIAYVDVSGEIDFVASVVDRHHRAAEASGARIVQVCGFEALPFDLLAALAIERLRAEHDQAPTAIEAVCSATPPPGRPLPSDMVSNGTFESLREAIAGEHAELLGDPAALVGDLADRSAVRAASPIRNRPRRRPGAGPLAPMLPSPVINPPVIQRSLALAGLAPVPYREGISLDGMVPRPLQTVAAGGAAALNAGLALLTRAPQRARRAGAGGLKLLSPSGGPRPERLEGWRWSVECTVRGDGGAAVGTRADAVGHPGYLATSKMTAEAGLILGDPGASTPERVGVLTPAAALGTGELGRFEAAGLRFS
jgi:short subunit dehydrogenase-like uncharacterized protein